MSKLLRAVAGIVQVEGRSLGDQLQAEVCDLDELPPRAVCERTSVVVADSDWDGLGDVAQELGVSRHDLIRAGLRFTASDPHVRGKLAGRLRAMPDGRRRPREAVMG